MSIALLMTATHVKCQQEYSNFFIKINNKDLMSNTEEIKKAIRSLGRYTENQCKVFDELINLAADNITYFSVVDMNKKINVTRPTIYNALKVFIKDNILEDNNKIGTYAFQKDTLDLLLKLYKKKK
jgi:Fe2+ or Zn2+ uptake regulation protein